MKVTASQLRQDIYKILDSVLQTGRPVEISRKGQALRIVPVRPVSWFDSLETRDVIVGDPESIVHVDWTAEWKPGNR